MGWLTRGRQVAAALLFLATLLAGMPAAARNLLTLDGGRQHMMLQDRGDAWVDESGRLPIEQVAGNADIRWHATNDENIYKLEKGQALWVRFTVPAMPTTERWYLEIPYPGVDRVTLFVKSANGWISTQTTYIAARRAARRRQLVPSIAVTARPANIPETRKNRGIRSGSSCAFRVAQNPVTPLAPGMSIMCFVTTCHSTTRTMQIPFATSGQPSRTRAVTASRLTPAPRSLSERSETKRPHHPPARSSPRTPRSSSERSEKTRPHRSAGQPRVRGGP